MSHKGKISPLVGGETGGEKKMSALAVRTAGARAGAVHRHAIFKE